MDDATGGGDAPETGGSAGSGRGGASGAGGVDPGCTSEVPPAAPLRRLNRFEYNNTVRDLFGDTSRPADVLPFDAYDDAATSGVSAALIEGYHTLSHDFAASVTEDAAATTAFIDCDVESEGEDTCRRHFISEFVPRVFRRPLTTDDVDEFSSVFENGQTLGGGFEAGVRAVVEVALQSPEFLYRPELGEPAAERGEGWARPTPYEMATRLSYAFWGTTPDAELYEAAANDELGSPGTFEFQVRRLLADERARDVVGYFYLRLLHLHGATFPAAGTATHPTFTAELAPHLLGETQAFVADLTLGGHGDFRTLLTAPYTFVNEPLADFYGISGISGSSFQRVNVGRSQRGGLLTHASFLASTSQSTTTDPSHRGSVIASALLCVPIPTPPATETIAATPPDLTTRQALERQVASPACAGCHSLFDPLGFAFEHYDAAGLWRDTENGLPIDASVSLSVADIDGNVDGALELAERLAESEDARRCLAQNWFSFAHGRTATAEDACFVEKLDQAFTNADTNLLELLFALALSDAFLYRPEVTP